MTRTIFNPNNTSIAVLRPYDLFQPSGLYVWIWDDRRAAGLVNVHLRFGNDVTAGNLHSTGLGLELRGSQQVMVSAALCGVAHRSAGAWSRASHAIVPIVGVDGVLASNAPASPILPNETNGWITADALYFHVPTLNQLVGAFATISLQAGSPLLEHLDAPESIFSYHQGTQHPAATVLLS